MITFSHYAVLASLGLVLLSWVLYVSAFLKSRTVVAAQVPVAARSGRAGGGSVAVAERPTPPPTQAGTAVLANSATQVARLAFVILVVAMIVRGLATGHGPFSNQYEFTVAFATGMVGAYVVTEWKYQVRTLALVVLPWATAALVYAAVQDFQSSQLVPALQNSFLLTLHVVVAIFAYGAFAVSFAAAALYLWTEYVTIPKGKKSHLPSLEVLDRVGYKAVIIGFPMLSAVIVLGAVWADIAWGSYWSWDPKETASLVTWLIYGGYLHARTARGWVGRGAAWLLVLGFASVLLTFLGNLIFGGLHSYA